MRVHTDGYTDTLTDTLTDADWFYNLPHVIAVRQLIIIIIAKNFSV